MLDKLWDDVVAGPQPEAGLEKLRRATRPLVIGSSDLVGESSSSKMQGTVAKPSFPSSPTTPMTPGTPTTASAPTTPSGRPKNNVWRSVFNPGSNLAMKNVGSDIFDKPQPNSPSVYDWYNIVYDGCTVGIPRALIGDKLN